MDNSWAFMLEALLELGIHVRKHLFFRFLIKVKSVCVICKFNK